MNAVGAAASIAGAYTYIHTLIYIDDALLYVCGVYDVCISIKRIFVRTTKYLL
jgi:hypothetical protein